MVNLWASPPVVKGICLSRRKSAGMGQFSGVARYILCPIHPNQVVIPSLLSLFLNSGFRGEVRGCITEPTVGRKELPVCRNDQQGRIVCSILFHTSWLLPPGDWEIRTVRSRSRESHADLPLMMLWPCDLSRPGQAPSVSRDPNKVKTGGYWEPTNLLDAWETRGQRLLLIDLVYSSEVQ